MEYIQGKPRSQLVFIESSLEDKIEADNPVRIIDTFVHSLNLEEFGFTHARHAPEGRPLYNPGDLLKLYIYGYLNRVRNPNHNDTHALANMNVRAKAIIGNDDFNELADKGYHTGEEIRRCHEAGVETLVAIPKTPVSSQAPDPAYNQDQFLYNKENDCYICPQGQELTSSGTWYQHHPYKTKQYKTKACRSCPVHIQCTRSKKGHVIERNENIENTQRNKQAIETNRELYKRRQEIVEHPGVYPDESGGTIKRQWGSITP